jgi:hypothetical protein
MGKTLGLIFCIWIEQEKKAIMVVHDSMRDGNGELMLA